MTLRVRDSKGGITNHSKQVVVTSQAAFETSLQQVWADFKISLQNGDITSALECMHSTVRGEYQKLLPAVLKSGTPINEILTDIRFQRLDGLTAEFEMTRMGSRGEFSYLVDLYWTSTAFGVLVLCDGLGSVISPGAMRARPGIERRRGRSGQEKVRVPFVSPLPLNTVS